MRNCFILPVEDNPKRYPQIAIADLVAPGEFVPGAWTITRINVPAAHRGKGLGSKLLSWILAAADEDRVTLALEIMPSGPLDYDELQAWYERNDFKESRKYPGIYIRRAQCPVSPAPSESSTGRTSPTATGAAKATPGGSAHPKPVTE